MGNVDNNWDILDYIRKLMLCDCRLSTDFQIKEFRTFPKAITRYHPSDICHRWTFII